MSGVQNKLEDAAALGFYPVRVSTGGPGRPATRWACKCTMCNAETSFGWSGFIPPEMMAKNAQQAGWEYRHKKLVCPTCIASEKEGKMATKIETVANPKLQRKVFALLDDHFNETTRLYAAGWSDKKVAEAAETSEQYVASVRKGAYGELAEDPAITAIRNEIAELNTKREKLGDEMLAKLTEMGEKITQLHVRLDGYAMKKAS